MDSDQSNRGRSSYRRRGGGGRGGNAGAGTGDSGSSGEYRGRGRGGQQHQHHRGRGKRDHRRGRGHEQGPPADFRNFRQGQDEPCDKENVEEEEEQFTFSRRKLESNWDRYEESEKEEVTEDVPTQRGADYHVLLTSAGDSFAQFRFSDEKDWEIDSLAKNQIPALFIDTVALAQALQELPLHTRLNMEEEFDQVSTPVELPMMSLPLRTELTAMTKLADQESGLRITCAVKPVSESTVPFSGPSEDTDGELELLLSLEKPLTDDSIIQSQAPTEEPLEMHVQGSDGIQEETKVQEIDLTDSPSEVKSDASAPRQEVTEEDLEDWLDSMIT